MENVNIPQDSIWAQKDEIDSKKVYKKVNFDTKNYLNVKLKDSEVTRTVTIRLLPFTPEGGSPFHLIHSHGIKVNKELAPQSAKPYKAYVCCKHTTELHEKYGNKCAICDAHDEFSRKMKTAETEEKKKCILIWSSKLENLKVGLFDVLSEVKKMKVLNFGNLTFQRKMMVFMTNYLICLN